MNGVCPHCGGELQTRTRDVYQCAECESILERLRRPEVTAQ